jgi:hypothetical protein
MIDEIKFWKLLSAYFDERFDWTIHSEVDRFLLDDPEVRAFFNTLNKTIELYQKIEVEELNVPEQIHIQLYQVLKKEHSKPKRKRAKKPKHE